jgi:hypothetical protein
MEACLEALLEMDFCTKSPIFGVETHMEAPAGDALRTATAIVIFRHVENPLPNKTWKKSRRRRARALDLRQTLADDAFRRL